MPDDLNLNYVGSSGWGILPDGRYGRLTNPPKPPTGNQRQDYGVYDITQNRVVSILTGKPWTGVEPRTGVTYAAGQPSAQSANTVNAPGIGPVNPNDPSQVFKPFTLPKDPAMEATRQQLIQEFSKANADALTGVNEYLKGFQDQLQSGATAMNAATDPTAAVAALRGAQGGYNTELDAATAAYQRALEQQATGMRGVVGQAQTDLDAFNAAQDAVKADQMAQFLKGWKMTKLAQDSGVGGYDTAILAREAARASIPIELAKQERRYDILRSMALPVEQNIGANAIAYASGFLPGIAGSRFAANTNIPIQIQNLLQQTAGMKIDAAVKLMQSQGVPAEIINRVISMQVANAGALTQLGDLTQYRAVQDVLGANLREPVGYNLNMGPLPSYAQATPIVNNQMTRTMTTPAYTTPAYRPGGFDAGVPYRPITGAPGGPAFDYASYFAQFQPDWQGPPRYPITQPAPNTGTGIGYISSPDYGITFGGTNADEYNRRFGVAVGG